MEFKASMDFDLFKSNVCHELKSTGSDLEFAKIILREHRIEDCWNNKKYDEALYYYSMIRYFCRIHAWKGIVLFPELQTAKLYYTVVPCGAWLTDRLAKDKSYTSCKECVKNAIPEFIDHNIAEGDIRDVV